VNQKNKRRNSPGRSSPQSRSTTKPRSGPATPTSSGSPSQRDSRSKAAQVKETPKGGSAGPKAASHEQASDTDADDTKSQLDRVLEKAAQPGRIVTFLVVLLLVVAGWRWPRYVVNPTSVTGSPHRGVTVAIAAVLFLSFSTLTFLMYCLLFNRRTKNNKISEINEINKRFVAAALNRAGIGATLGTLLGVRLAPALLDPASGTSATFPEYLGDIGNAITLLTLVLIATLWAYSAGLFRQVLIYSFDRDPIRVIPVRQRKLVAMLFIIGVNAVGFELAFAVYHGLNRH
jgi:hypothetical protein